MGRLWFSSAWRQFFWVSDQNVDNVTQDHFIVRASIEIFRLFSSEQQFWDNFGYEWLFMLNNFPFSGKITIRHRSDQGGSVRPRHSYILPWLASNKMRDRDLDLLCRLSKLIFFRIFWDDKWVKVRVNNLNIIPIWAFQRRTKKAPTNYEPWEWTASVWLEWLNRLFQNGPFDKLIVTQQVRSHYIV